MSRTLDFIPNKNIKIYQDDEMFRINTDTMALGEFIEIKHKDTVIDIGTNTGALMLYASLFEPREITGIDVNERALELAKMNLDVNGVKNYTLIHQDVTTYKEKEYDVVICNPPYFDKVNLLEYQNMEDYK